MNDEYIVKKKTIDFFCKFANNYVYGDVTLLVPYVSTWYFWKYPEVSIGYLRLQLHYLVFC